MKAGCFFAMLAIAAGLVFTLVLSFALELILPAHLHANVEGIGQIVFTFVWFVAVPAGFIYGYRLQAREKAQEEAKKPRPPENLRPIDYSRLGETLKKTPASDDRNQDAKPPGSN